MWTQKIISLGFVLNLFFCETAFSDNGYKSSRGTFEDKSSVFLSHYQIPSTFVFGTQELKYSGPCFSNSSDPGVSFQINGTPVQRNGYNSYNLDFISEDENLHNTSTDSLELSGGHETSPIPVLFTNYVNQSGRDVEVRITQIRSPYPDQPMETLSLKVRIQVSVPIWMDDIYVCNLFPVENS